MASNQLRTAQRIGFFPPAPWNGINYTTLNAAPATTMLAFSFTPDQSKTLTSVRVPNGSVTGTPTASSFTCEIWTDSSGNPGSIIAGATSVASAVPVSSSWLTFSAFTTPPALTAGVEYWAVLKNTDAAPASNYTLFYYGAADTGTGPQNSDFYYGNNLYGWRYCVYATGWGTPYANTCGMRIGYNDATYDGLPARAISAGSDKVYGSNESGVSFVSPLNATLNIRGISFYGGKSGAPTGNLRFKLYTGALASPTLQATSNAIAPANIPATTGYLTSYFSATVSVAGNTTVIVSLSDSAADSATAYYYGTLYTMDTDANSTPLYPFASSGVQQMVTSINGGTSFSGTAGNLYPFALLLDTSGEFTASGGGSSMKVYPGMDGGMHG